MKKGDRFSHLEAMSFLGRDHNGHRRWLFKCDCGNRKEISEAHVTSGRTKSCGCFRKAVTTERMTRHGEAKRTNRTRTYKAWGSMVARCTIKSATGYDRYGGAGVTVCDRWKAFENFLADMGECPAGMSIERMDNSKGYEPANCKWATRTEQNNNRRSVRFIEFNGEVMTATQWAKKLGISKATMYERLAKWPLDKALTTPKQSQGVDKP
jgi:hypothetical protein